MDSEILPFATTLEVRDRCLCLHLQRAARTIARQFDEVLRPHGLTNGQFSMLMGLNRKKPPRLTDLVPLLGMDRTTLTAALKPLERKGFVEVVADPDDRRARRLLLTAAGKEALAAATPVWREAHDALDARLSSLSPQALRDGLTEII